MANQLIVKKKYMWKIDNINLANVNNYNTAKLVTSKPFKILLGNNKTEWNFFFHPKSNDNCKFLVHNISLDNKDFRLKFNVCILKRIGSLDCFKQTEIQSSNIFQGKVWGWAQYLKSDEMLKESNRYVINNVLTLCISLELTQEGPQAKKPRYCSNAEWTSVYFDSKDFSDLTIICSDERKIPAHRNILAGQSKVFKTMLTTDMIEKKSNEIVVNDVDGDTMLELLRYLYTMNVENLKKHAPKLLDCAEKYDIPGLKAISIDELINQLSDENVLEHIQRANLYNDQKLMNACLDHIDTNFSKLKSQNWKKLNNELIADIMEYMHSGPKRFIILINSL